MMLGFVTSVVNLKRQDIHLKRASRSTVPDTENGTPYKTQELIPDAIPGAEIGE